MVLVILAIGLIVTAGGLIIEYIAYRKSEYDDWGDHFPFIWISGGIVTFVALIVILILSSRVVQSRYIDDKVDMYEQENAVIEEQIADAVNDYIGYEQGIFEDISPDEVMTVVLLYPDLKANTVVEKQMEVYIANNQKIKELKEQYIHYQLYKWWLYFGG